MPARGYDAIIIGGGFYGLSLALHLSGRNQRILVVEAGPVPMSRASLINQARVHAGFHYPRNFVTALRCLQNYPRFVEDFRPAIVDNFGMLYAIARRHSKVNAKRFQTMFSAMRSPIDAASPSQRALFNTDMIEAVFLCRESAVDCSVLRDLLLQRLEGRHVELLLATRADRITSAGNGILQVNLSNGTAVAAPLVFNITYSQLNTLLTGSGAATIALKHELAEVALIDPPRELAGLAITVMDGPFFSTMPFPGSDLYSLTHVRYTPHVTWRDETGNRDAYSIAAEIEPASQWRHMISDAQRFVPSLAGTVRQKSLFTVKTVPVKNDDDDGRPILFRPAPGLPGLYSVLGSKLDNIYDLFQVVDSLG